jgi:large exoprotein involved in heme utilization and adhesion
LFFINPNGILIGNNAELNIGGSFIASTASSVNFADGNKFSANSSNPQQLLTVNSPIGLQFGTTANPIRLSSQASPDNATNSLGFPVGLQVKDGKTLALIGGDIMLSGGNLTAVSGQIELLSVGSDSKVSLQPTPLGWVFGTAYVKNFQDIKLISRSGIRSIVDASGEGSGNINLQGKYVLLTGASTVVNIKIFPPEVFTQLEIYRDEIAVGQYQIQNGKAENPQTLAQHLQKLRQQRNELQNRYFPVGYGFKFDSFQPSGLCHKFWGFG